jgi:hypothetical protein
VQIKTRKRNIAVALDPGSFADAVVTIFEDAKDGNDLEKNLAAGVKVLEGTQLDFSRYGDTLFEVFFAGGRLAAGGNVVEEGKRLDTNVRSPQMDTYTSARKPVSDCHDSVGTLSVVNCSQILSSFRYLQQRQKKRPSCHTSRCSRLCSGTLGVRHPTRLFILVCGSVHCLSCYFSICCLPLCADCCTSDLSACIRPPQIILPSSMMKPLQFSA